MSNYQRGPDGRWMSADGKWWWDGQHWQPVPKAPMPLWPWVIFVVILSVGAGLGFIFFLFVIHEMAPK